MLGAQFIELKTLSTKSKKIRIPKEVYDIVHEILTSLLKEENEISLQQLIQIGEEKINFHDQDELPWMIVQIKNDLLNSHVLTVEIDKDRNQIIRLKNNKASSKLGHLHPSLN